MIESAHLERLAPPWRSATRPALRSAWLGCILGAIILGAPLARLGTAWARAGVGLAVLSALSLGLYAWCRHVRTGRSLRRLLARVLMKADGPLGSRALRAYSLAEQARAGVLVGSSELAREHFARIIGQVREEDLAAFARRRMRVHSLVGLVSGSAALVAALAVPGIVLEGLDVLVASGGRAPFPMLWLHAVEVEVRPPAYLRMGPRQLYNVAGASVPAGSVVVVRGKPLRPNRKLVVTDGTRELPFAADGEGGVSCEWELSGNAGLRIGARFGDVLVLEPETLELAVVPDTRPQVTLEGTPRTLRIAELDRVELRYVATDDHGLTQIDLVLDRSETQERRLLDKLDGQSRSEVGSYVLSADDRFLREAFLPVVVRIEARDTSERGGVVWGRSAEITLLPNAVGQSEAARYVALTNAIGGLVDAFAHEASRQEQALSPQSELQTASEALHRVASQDYFGLELGPGLGEFIRGQTRLLDRDPPGTVARLSRMKGVILALDVAARRLSVRDARRVSIRLSKIAEEIANTARHQRRAERMGNPAAHLVTAGIALRQGIDQLTKLGSLGVDLGGVARADFARLERSRARGDMTHVWLIASHIATRLGRPAPSFGSAAQSGVESGPSSVQPVDGSSSEAEKKFDELAAELAELATEHAVQVGDVETALEQAASAAEPDAEQAALDRRARGLREAASELPRIAPDAATRAGQAALAREHVEAMADAMEQGTVGQALEQARDATEALRQAEQRSQADFLEQPVSREQLQRAEQAVKAQLGFIEALATARMRAQQTRAREALKTLGARERELAKRAANLEARGRRSNSPLSEANLERLRNAAGLMRQAAGALDRTDGDAALGLQQAAQQLLEQSDMGQTAEEPMEHASGSEDGGPHGRGKLSADGSVPGKNPGERAQAFRRRVLEGLKRGRATRLAPAVQRYAEELLQ